MKLLLANESDCCFFKFWFKDEIRNGINYQGKMFYQFHSFSSQRRDQAYDLGYQLLERSVSVLIACSKERYILGINLRSDWWTMSDADKQQILSGVQGLESVTIKLLT